MRIGRAHRALVRPAGDGRRRREQPDATRAAAGDGELRGGRDDADHVDPAVVLREVLLERPERRRARRVAGDDDQLGLGLEQVVGDLDREPLELRLRPLAVREPGRVPEVDVVLGRQRHEQLVQDGEPADAGIEHGDGLLRRGAHGGPWCQSHWR